MRFIVLGIIISTMLFRNGNANHPSLTIRRSTQSHVQSCLHVILTAVCLCLALPAAQHKVDPANSYHRVIVVVPLVGKGTYLDPKRPLYAPVGVRIAGNRAGIISFYQQLTDDKKSAIVEFVAFDRAALAPILNDKSLKVFEKGKNLKSEVEFEMKKVKKDFDSTNFGLAVR